MSQTSPCGKIEKKKKKEKEKQANSDKTAMREYRKSRP